MADGGSDKGLIIRKSVLCSNQNCEQRSRVGINTVDEKIIPGKNLYYCHSCGNKFD